MAARQLGVVGLGGMGSGIAHALLDAGLAVTVYNRTVAKAAALERAGARVASSVRALGAVSDVLLLSLSDEAVVEEVLFGALVSQLRPGAVVVDTSTVSPSYARSASARLAASGVRRVEACVVGNPQMARSGQLRVFTAGVDSDVDDVADVLHAISREVRYLGPAGRASVLKLAFNLLLGVQTAGLAEAVAFVEGAGMDRELLLAALKSSAWGSPALGFRAEFMRRRSYQPAGFRAALMCKDLRLVHEEGTAYGVELPLTGRTVECFGQVVSAGRGDADAAVIAECRPMAVHGAVAAPEATHR